MTPRICVSILPKNMVEALNQIDGAEKAKADLIEVRLDCLEESRNLSDLAKSTKLPLIATNKLVSERGMFAGTEAERQNILLNAAKNGFEYVDVDLSILTLNKTVQSLKEIGAKTIVSLHKYDGVLSHSAMENVLKQEIESGANICKIVTTAKKAEDNLTTLNFVSRNVNKAKLVCFCMGEVGKISRLLSPIFGAFFTFASLEVGSETATGQMSIKEMQTAYNLLGA